MIPCGKLWSGHDLIVTVRLPDQKPRVVHLNQPFARIGAHPKADIRLPDETRSLRALYLHATEEGIFCLNLDPTAGPRSTTRWLGPGRSAQVGPVVVEAAFADEPKRLLRAHGDLRLCQLSQAAAAPIQVRIANQDQTAALK